MKKFLFTLTFVGGFLSINAQLTFVGDAALVHISDQALVYSGGGVKLSGTATVNTIGDFMINTSTEGFDVASTADFRLKYSSPTVYGQLFIQGMPQNNITGKVNKEYVDVIHGNTGRQQVALPYYNFTAGDIQSVLPYVNITNNALTSTGRWNPRSIFKWNNSTSAFDQLTGAATVVGKPTDYYILSRRNYDKTIAWDPTVTAENPTALLTGTTTGSPVTAVNTMKKIFKGVPVSDAGTDTQVTLSGAFTGNFGTNGTLKNQYNELYNSYVDDPFVTSKWTGDYGQNIYQYGNPFLTNVDLSLVKKGDTSSDDLNAISNLNGIYYYSSGIQNSWSGSTYTSATGVKVTFDSAGDIVGGLANDLVIKPMQEVLMKVTSTASQTLNFNKTRRFAQTARLSTTSYSVTAAKNSENKSNLVTKQLGVVLLDSNDKELGRTFYVVNNEAITGFNPDNARLQATTTDTSIYTKEELTTGGLDSNRDYNLYINEANELDFAGKQIPLVINNANVSKLKFFLIEGGSLLGDSQVLSNGKSFYFGNNGVLTKIDSGTTISITNNTYGLFYEQPAGVLGTSELLNGQTIVAKKDANYVVRFNKNWKTADIEIYSSVGQLIFTAKKVSTNKDYQLPLSESLNAVYIVKIKSNNGEIVTKKVIK